MTTWCKVGHWENKKDLGHKPSQGGQQTSNNTKLLGPLCVERNRNKGEQLKKRICKSQTLVVILMHNIRKQLNLIFLCNLSLNHRWKLITNSTYVNVKCYTGMTDQLMTTVTFITNSYDVYPYVRFSNYRFM